jgi:2-amino-4-hydroxy-6-hydroxymethyldihydropteridine diphosphokinase
MQDVYVGFGGNLGDVAATFDAALSELLAESDARFISSSFLYRSPPWGGVAQPDYLNAVVHLQSARSAQSLLQLMLSIEKRHGRDRNTEVRWGARTLDLDLLLYGDSEIDEDHLQVPHPRVLARAFVVIPLLDIADPQLRVNGVTLRDAAETHSGAIIEKLPRQIQPESKHEADSTT